MLENFIITFRETLETALIVGIILSYLVKIKQTKYNNIVYVGIAGGIMASILGALLFIGIAGEFEGKAEQIFEGTTMLIGAVLLATMILWMMNQKNVAGKLQNRVDSKLDETRRFGLFLLVFVSVVREGIETVIFLGATSFVSKDNNMIGALAGIAAAILLGYLIFVGSMKINVKKFFNITSIVLILFGAQLVANSAHEFQEAGLIEEISPLLSAIISYAIYFAVVLILWKRKT